jgi:D-glycero-alpha-D-manno-heptose-7-phosphate kinase
VIATAPVRVCDVGGWTDTWFAGHGRVCSIAVRPGVRVEVRPGARDGAGALLDAVLAEAGVHDVHLVVTSAVPPGSSLGTSAAVVVAALAALGVPRDELARRAHRVETEHLGLQSGVQDQHAAVDGGAALLTVDYPDVERRRLAVPGSTWQALGERLVTCFLGEHRSSAVHERVIADLTGDPRPLEELRSLAGAAADALVAGDLLGYGRTLARSTEAQRSLHPSLVSAAAEQVIDAARAAGALGWKVNGAGGDGGTVTVLLGDDPLPRIDGAVALRLRPTRRGVIVRGGGSRGPRPRSS